MTEKHGIFCIEGEWESNLQDQTSTRPLIEFLANSDNHITPIYRRVATIESFSYFAARWNKYPKHTVGYFTFHGEKGSLCLGAERLKLSALGERLAGSCKGKHIVFGSCRTLDVPNDQLIAFRKQTAARSVSGYKKNPHLIESSAFDLILMANLLHHDSPAKTESWLRKRCAGLMDEYGFVMDYRTRATGG